MAETREHPPVDEIAAEKTGNEEAEKLEEALGAALLLVQGQLPRIRPAIGRFSLNLLTNGEAFAVDVEELTSTHIQFLISGRRFRTEFESSVPDVKSVGSSAPRMRPSVSGDGVLRTPIPGIVAAILVAEGDTVEAEQPVIRIEAMKMQNALAAGKAGKVAKVFVTSGQEVGEGDPLLQIG